AGSIMATVNTLAGDLYSVRERGRIQGWLSSVWGVAAIAGPTLGGAFAQYASWRWIFLINLPLGALAIGLIAHYLHEHKSTHAHRIDYAGSALMLIAGGGLVFGLLQGGHAWPWLSWPSVVVFVAAACACLATLWVEARHAAEPILPPWLWRNRVLSASNVSMIGMGLVIMGPSAYLPTFGQSVLGMGAIAAGLVLASISIGWPLASSLSSHVYMRIGYRDTALAGALLVVLAAIGFLLLPFPGSIIWLLVDQIALGAGFGLMSTPLLVGVQSSVGWEQRGVVTGANMFSRYLGESLGAAIFGAIFNSAMATQLARAPTSLRQHLPEHVDGVISALHGGSMHGRAEYYLRHAMYSATHHVYIGVLIVALLSLLVVLLTPRHFPQADEAPDSSLLRSRAAARNP
ncbi:MAG: MFS transporter, partial [Xanthomonadales bacterium]|nr:MFS transporter [Xanthomonadales bacterium]